MLKSMLLLFLSFSYESKVVGEAGDQILTSRQVSAYVIFSSLYDQQQGLVYKMPLDEQELMSATSNLLMEFLIVEEAKSFDLAKVDKSEVNKTIRTFQKRLNNKAKLKKIWESLDLNKEETFQIAEKKIRSDKFLKSKIQTFNIDISPQEVEQSYNNKQAKYKDIPSEKAKEEIRNQIQEKKLQAALREWFQILRTKYVVKNLLI